MSEELILKALRMLKDRARYYERLKSGNCWGSYASAVEILEAAINGQNDVLSQYDYYGEND